MSETRKERNARFVAEAVASGPITEAEGQRLFDVILADDREARVAASVMLFVHAADGEPIAARWARRVYDACFKSAPDAEIEAQVRTWEVAASRPA